MRLTGLSISIITVFLAIAGCTDNLIPENNGDSDKGSKPKLAVFVNAYQKNNDKMVADIVSRNFGAAQSGCDRTIDIDIDFIDIDSCDIAVAMEKAGIDTSCLAIIAPPSSTDAARILYIARNLNKYGIQKPVILPSSTSVELQREYSDLDFVWFIPECDISQGEMMLSLADSIGMREIDVIATDDEYGHGFLDYIPFMTTEWGLQTGNLVTIPDNAQRSDLESIISEICQKDKSCKSISEDKMIVVASSVQNHYEIIDSLNYVWNLSGKRQHFYFTDAAYTSSAKSYKNATGLTLSAIPSSGFREYFKNLTGNEPLNNEAQLYDAILMAHYALFASKYDYRISPNTALSLFSLCTSESQSWNPEGIREMLHDISLSIYRGMNLASCHWEEVASKSRNVSESTYALWSAKNGNVTLERFVEAGKYSHRTDKSGSVIDWSPAALETDIDQDLRDGKVYEDGGENWALIVAASEGWDNYRHQADALYMYKVLRMHGYDDDHIVLIMNDDLAYNSQNIYPGHIYNQPDGDDLYSGAVCDYITKELSPSLLGDIIAGNSSEKLPYVISASRKDNILIYWSGHGTYNNELCWTENLTDTYATISIDDINSWINKADEKGFNKMMMVVEACYSGGIARGIAHPGVLVMTAAGVKEKSKAYGTISKDLHTYLADEFSLNFTNKIIEKKDISIHDLYREVYFNTKMSHITISDYSYYGSLFRNKMSDYLPK